MIRKINLLREFSVPLIAGTLTALAWANIAPESYRDFNYGQFLGAVSFNFLSNDVFMVFFFAIAAAEITQSCLPGGDLNPVKKAVNPLLATVGGVIGPIMVYLTLNQLIGSPALSRGWGIPVATDIAFAWMAGRLIFGANHPVIAFLLLFSIADDAVGLIIIALFYSDPLTPVAPLWLLLTGAGMIVALLLRSFRVKNYWPYLLGGGIPSWLGLLNAHLHPALALVFIIPFLPHPERESRHLFEEDPRDYSTLAKFEHEWKIIVDFGLFMFGLANAGLEFTAADTATWLVFFALLFGKTIGIFSMGLIGDMLGFNLPRGMTRKDLFITGLIAGIGFTVALFIAGEAFTDPALIGAAKRGAILSISLLPLAWGVARLLGIKKKSDSAKPAD